MSFRQAVARFNVEVDHALTRARKAAREARAETGEFRRRTEELSRQAKTGKPRGLRRARITATSPEAREEATKFRVDNGLPVPELPAGGEPEPRVTVRENEDFSQHQVLFDVDSAGSDPAPAEPDRIDTPEPEDIRPSDAEEDFSQERILMDATVESYRPDEISMSVYDPVDPETTR